MSLKPTYRKDIPVGDYIGCHVCYEENKIDIVRCIRCENEVCFSCYNAIQSKKCPYCRTIYDECNRYIRKGDGWVKHEKVKKYVRARRRIVLIAHNPDKKDWFSHMDVEKIIEMLSESLDEDNTLFNEKLKILEMRDYNLYIQVFKKLLSK